MLTYCRHIGTLVTYCIPKKYIFMWHGRDSPSWTCLLALVKFVVVFVCRRRFQVPTILVVVKRHIILLLLRFFPKTRDETYEEVQLYFWLQSLVDLKYISASFFFTNHNHFDPSHFFQHPLEGNPSLRSLPHLRPFRHPKSSSSNSKSCAPSAKPHRRPEGDDNLVNITYKTL